MGALYVLLGVTQGPCREGTQATGLGSRSRKALVPWSTLLHGVAVAGGWERGLESPTSHRAGQKEPQDPMPLWPFPELLASLCPRVNKDREWGRGYGGAQFLWEATVKEESPGPGARCSTTRRVPRSTACLKVLEPTPRWLGPRLQLLVLPPGGTAVPVKFLRVEGGPQGPKPS